MAMPATARADNTAPGQLIKLMTVGCKEFPPLDSHGIGHCVSPVAKSLHYYYVSASGLTPNESAALVWGCTAPSCAGAMPVGTTTTDSSGNLTAGPFAIPSTATAGSSYVLGMLGATGDIAYGIADITS